MQTSGRNQSHREAERRKTDRWTDAGGLLQELLWPTGTSLTVIPPPIPGLMDRQWDRKTESQASSRKGIRQTWGQVTEGQVSAWEADLVP